MIHCSSCPRNSEGKYEGKAGVGLGKEGSLLVSGTAMWCTVSGIRGGIPHGCQAYQGYLFARPLPLADFESLVRQAYIQ